MCTTKQEGKVCAVYYSSPLFNTQCVGRRGIFVFRNVRLRGNINYDPKSSELFWIIVRGEDRSTEKQAGVQPTQGERKVRKTNKTDRENNGTSRTMFNYGTCREN